MPFSNPAELLGSLGLLSIVILMILSIFSIVSWGIIVNKFRQFRRINEEEMRFLQIYEINPVDQKPLRSQAKNYILSPSSMVYLGVTDRLPVSPDLFTSRQEIDSQEAIRPLNRQYLEKVAQHIIQGQINLQEAYLPFLATTGNLTPFIGSWERY